MLFYPSDLSATESTCLLIDIKHFVISQIKNRGISSNETRFHDKKNNFAYCLYASDSS